jgi:Predicted hydrolase (HAD superfamily)
LTRSKPSFPDVDPADLLVIGDSLTADIQGANHAGLDSVWFNPQAQPVTAVATPTYQVNSLTQIPDPTALKIRVRPRAFS